MRKARTRSVRAPEERLKIRNLIQDAFGNAEYPGDENLVATEPLADQIWRQRIAKSLRGKDWTSISPLEDKEVSHDGSDLLYLTSAAFCYYLPAYLIACIDDFDEADVMGATVIHVLTPPSDEGARNSESKKTFDNKIKKFSRVQREAICAFLAYVFNNYREDFFIGENDPISPDYTACLEFWNVDLTD